MIEGGQVLLKEAKIKITEITQKIKENKADLLKLCGEDHCKNYSAKKYFYRYCTLYRVKKSANLEFLAVTEKIITFKLKCKINTENAPISLQLPIFLLLKIIIIIKIMQI